MFLLFIVREQLKNNLVKVAVQILSSASINIKPQFLLNTVFFSVFPAEACETIGGDACLADIFPEVKLNPEASSKRIASEPFDRDYLEYNDPKTY